MMKTTMKNMINELVTMETTPTNKPNVFYPSDLFGSNNNEISIHVRNNLFYTVREDNTVSIWDDQTCQTLATFDNAKDAHNHMTTLLQP